MKFRRTFIIFLSIVMALSGFSAYAETTSSTESSVTAETTEITLPPETGIPKEEHIAGDAELGDKNLSITGGSHSIDGQVPVLGTEQFITNATSVLLYETRTDTIMYAWNADAPQFPASLVKIMTALLTIERCTLTDAVTVSEQALATVDKTAVSSDLKPGEVITIENLLYCMLVDSANDAAAVLAESVSGSQDSFVAAMNKRAAELGCKNTHFTNPHGLHDDNQVTTARDVGRILTAALKNQKFSDIFGTIYYKIPATNQSPERKLESGNFLMNMNSMEIYYDTRVTGGRTGVTADGSRCIAAAAKDGELQVVSVIMGAASEYEEKGSKVKSFGGFPETTKLLDRAFDGFRPAQIIVENQAFKQYPVENGTNDVVVCPLESIATVLPNAVHLQDLTYRYQERNGKISAPIEKGDMVASVEIWNGGICLGKAALSAMHRVEVKEIKTVQQEAPKPDRAFKIIGLSVGIAGGIAFLAVLRNLIVKKIQKSKRKRIRANRRRSR